MARPVRPWFRFYVEAVGDRKLRRLKPEYRWLFVACLGAARQSPIPGILLVSEGSPMDERDLADFAGMDVRSVRAGLRELERTGLIVRGSEGDREEIAYRSPTFQRRQFESDDVTKRTRKHRLTSADVGEGTFHHGSQERSGNGGRNAPETETETDTSGGADEPPAATAQTYIAEWLDGQQKRPPSDVIGQVSKRLKVLVDDGIEPEAIRRGLAEWAGKSLHASALPSIVHDAQKATASNVVRLPDGRLRLPPLPPTSPFGPP